MSVSGGSHVLTHMSWCDMDLLGVGNCLQMRSNVNHTVSWSKLYAEPVQQIICIWSCTPVVWF